jgi:hypothetical protein
VQIKEEKVEKSDRIKEEKKEKVKERKEEKSGKDSHARTKDGKEEIKSKEEKIKSKLERAKEEAKGMLTTLFLAPFMKKKLSYSHDPLFGICMG